MATIKNTTDLYYDDVHFCICDCDYTTRLAKNGQMKKITVNWWGNCKDDQTVEDVMKSGDWHCPMITKESKNGVKILYESDDCPDHLRKIIKLPLFNRSSVVLNWNVDDMTISASQEEQIIEHMRMVDHCRIFGIDNKILHTVDVDGTEYKILYLEIGSESG
jgi:hypothetical protein